MVGAYKERWPINNDLYLEDWERGAHTIGLNDVSVGVCVVGSPKYKLHKLQLEAVWETLEILCNRYNLSYDKVFVHSEFNNTRCPGNELKEIVSEFNLQKRFNA